MVDRKTCLITGCSSGGVGPALVEVFRDQGYHVFATARTPAKVPQGLGHDPNVTILELDVTSIESIKAAATIVSNQTDGKLDVLINNAGHGLNMPALDTSMEEAKNLFDSNFFGVLQMIQAFQHMLVKAQGVIVNNSSVGAYQPFPFISTYKVYGVYLTLWLINMSVAMYQASKAALIAAGEGWRLELAPLGVRVITLVTGGIATKFLDNLQEVNFSEESYYKSIKVMISEHPERVPLGMEPRDFARDVLISVNRNGTGKVWVGGGSTMMRVALWLSPQCILVSNRLLS